MPPISKEQQLRRAHPDKQQKPKRQNPLRRNKGALQPSPEARKRAARTGTTLRQASNTPKAQARRQADRDWARETKRKYAGACILGLPGCRGRGTQAMHLYRKSTYPHLRHEPWNGAPGCGHCHRQADTDATLQAVLHQVAEMQRRWHTFDRIEPVTVAEIRQLIEEAIAGGSVPDRNQAPGYAPVAL